MDHMKEYLQSIYDQISELLSVQLSKQSTFTKTILIGTTAGAIAYSILKKRHRLPPGPLALPIVGNLLFIFSQKEGWAKSFLRLSKKYGPVFTIYQGPFPVIVLNDIKSINEALIQRSTDYSNRWIRHSFKLINSNGKGLVFSNPDEEWKARKKTTAKALSFIFLLRNYIGSSNFETHIGEAVTEAIQVMLQQTKPFDPDPFILFITINVLASMCFGTRYDYNDDNYKLLLKIMEDLGEVLGEGICLEDFISPLRLYPSKRFHKLQDISRRALDYVTRNIQEHRCLYNKDRITDLTYGLLKAEEDSREGTVVLNEEQIRSSLIDLVLAGNDTSRQTLYWAIFYLAAYPDIQNKIYQEVRRVVDKTRMPKITDREKLPYTYAFLHEVMRLGTAITVGVPHLTAVDTKIGEYDVPKNTTVFINHWGLHHDPDQWEDVETFKPERFLDHTGNMAPKPENWLPFSTGRRLCIGKTLAMPELHLIIASLVQRLEIRAEPGRPVNFEAKEGPMEYASHPYKIIVIDRNP
ncbi:hypothetical protein LOTGIDRAFT_182666 [Lottia gigantea]|uniref:Uncharacterized protein n=1 Tax=Lottia gigantea TaxID=225164 RepID=V4ADJ8_LOTGI|nr:hypothetical protein LOTGIDRAFT_182666 [Lottia gigantea]ESO91386.1 hypothetical protein LOTGIDRAFT_182666 [Lottia gigantea]